MRRALFSREFRSALVPNLVTAGFILGILVPLEGLYALRLGTAEEVRGVIDITLLAGLVLSGFISGERCFPAEFKKSQILFLHSLPISRTWAWLVIVSARLLAGLASMVIVATLRRPLLMRLYFGKFFWLGIALVLTAYIFFFSAGTLFALLFRRTFVSYVAGATLLGILLTETFFSSLYTVQWPKLKILSFLPLGSTIDVPLFSSFLSLFLFSSLLLSWRFFVHGEVGNRKNWVRNQFLFGITATAYLGFLFCAASSTKLASAWRTWESLDRDRLNFYSNVLASPLFGVSPNGRYLFVLESLHGRPFIVRVNIVDTQTGHVTYRSVYRGVGWVFWSGQGDVLNLLVLNNSPLDRWGYLVEGTVDWIRISPEGREISKLRLEDVEEVQILERGRALAVLQEGGLGRVDLLDGSSGQSSEVVHAPLDGYVTVDKNGPVALVCFNNTLLPSRVWLIDSLAHEVRVPKSALEEPGYVFFGEFFGSPAEVQGAMLRRFGPPLSPEGVPVRGSFLLPAPSRILNLASGSDMKAVYFLDQRVPAVLWARSTTSGGHWEELPNVASGFTNLANHLPKLIDIHSGIGVFRSAEDIRRFFVYDPRLGTSFEAKGCRPGTRAFLNINRMFGLRGVLITLICTDDTSPLRHQMHYFEHLPGSHERRLIKTVQDRPHYWPPPLYLNERGWEVWMSSDRQIEIWRSSPGKKDLRLWPPSDSLPSRFKPPSRSSP